MISCSQFEDEIFALEGVRVVLIQTTKKYTAPTELPSYAQVYTKPLSDDRSVKSLASRIYKLAPGVAYRVRWGDGRIVPSSLLNLGKLRATYPVTTNE